MPTCACDYCCTKPGFIEVVGANKRLSDREAEDGKKPEKEEKS